MNVDTPEKGSFRLLLLLKTSETTFLSSGSKMSLPFASAYLARSASSAALSTMVSSATDRSVVMEAAGAGHRLRRVAAADQLLLELDGLEIAAVGAPGLEPLGAGGLGPPRHRSAADQRHLVDQQLLAGAHLAGDVVERIAAGFEAEQRHVGERPLLQRAAIRQPQRLGGAAGRH